MSRFFRFFRRIFRRKKDLREKCRELYGDDFVLLYDMLGSGIPIGNFHETKLFLALVEKAREEMEEDP